MSTYESQVDVGEQGSAEHASRERLLRASIDMRASLSEAQGKYESRRSVFESLEGEHPSACGEPRLSAAQPQAEGGRAQPATARKSDVERSAEEQDILDSALRHAALSDPAAGRSGPWTLGSGNLGVLPPSARIAKQLAADTASKAVRRGLKSTAGHVRTEQKLVEAGRAQQVVKQRTNGQGNAPESTLRALLKQVG